MSVKTENFMVIKTDDGTSAEVLGKYMCYSLPNLVVKASRVKIYVSRLNSLLR